MNKLSYTHTFRFGSFCCIFCFLLSPWKMLFQRFSKLNTIFVAFFVSDWYLLDVSVVVVVIWLYKTLYFTSKSNRLSRHATNTRTPASTDFFLLFVFFSSLFVVVVVVIMSRTIKEKRVEEKGEMVKNYFKLAANTYRSVTKDVLY